MMVCTTEETAYTIEETARILSVNAETVQAWIERGELKKSTPEYVDEKEIIKFLQRLGQ